MSIIIIKSFHQPVFKNYFITESFISVWSVRLCNDEKKIEQNRFQLTSSENQSRHAKVLQAQNDVQEALFVVSPLPLFFLSKKAINYRLTAHNTPKFHLLHNNSLPKTNLVRHAVFYLRDNQTIPMHEQD